MIFRRQRVKCVFCVYPEEELRAELENLVRLEQQFADWEREMKSKMAVSERISEKTKAEGKQLTKEMQKQVSLKILSVTQVVYVFLSIQVQDCVFSLHVLCSSGMY
jgi:molecular chaperone GrpE (heat shock protein)